MRTTPPKDQLPPSPLTPTLPIELLLAPGCVLAEGVTNPYPFSRIQFVGWGGIRGPEVWQDSEPGRTNMMREVLLGLSRTASRTTPGPVVIDCEKRNGWIKQNPKRSREITNMLIAIFYGMKMIHGDDTPVSFVGPEAAIISDFDPVMMGSKTRWNDAWKFRPPMPFISPRYGANVPHVAGLLARIALDMGLSRGVVLWIQDKDAAAQRASFEYMRGIEVEYAVAYRAASSKPPSP